MQRFFCSSKERVMVTKVFDYLIKNTNISGSNINSFLEVLMDNLGLDKDGFDEITIDEFEEEFINYFKNNSQAKNIWSIIKKELIQNDCELWV